MNSDRTDTSALTRRSFLRAGTGIGAAIAMSGLVGSGLAQNAPYGGYLSNVSNFDGTTADLTGRDTVTIRVGTQGNNGNFAFGPPAVKVDPGTTVVWKWTGKGGQHNVVHEGGDFESKLTGEKGFTFDRTFEEAGVYKYFCRPHKGLGMKGVVAVGDTAQGEVVSPEDADKAGGGTGQSQGGDTEKPDFGGYLDDVGNYDGSVLDARGQDRVTVKVGAKGNGGNFAFSPPAVHVDAGTTVVWKWTGKGGQHNVVHEGGDFESKLTATEGFTFKQTFESNGIYNYYCQPHKGLGMKGSVVVGDNYPTKGAGAGEGSSAKTAEGGEQTGTGGDGISWPEGPEHKFLVLLFGLLGLTATFALLPELAGLPTTVSRAVSGVGSRLHARNAFRKRLLASTVLGWVTVLFALLAGAGLVAGLWLVSPSPVVFLGALGVVALVVALYAAERTGVRLGIGTTTGGGSSNRSSGHGGSSTWSTPGNPNRLDVGRTVDVLKGWFGVAMLLAVAVAIAVALWQLSGGGVVFLGSLGVGAVVVALYVLTSVR